MCIECFRLSVPCVCVCTVYTLQLFQFEWKAPSRLQPAAAAAAAASATDNGAGEGEPAARLAGLSSTYGLICCFVYYFIYNTYTLSVCACIVFKRQVQASSWRHGQIKRSSRQRYSCAAKEGHQKFVEYVLLPLIALNANTAMTSFVGGYCHTVKLKLSHELT